MELKEFFSEHPRAALAFSGGVDSAYLLYAGLQYAEDLGVYYVRSAFQPAFEAADAQRLADSLGAKLHILPLDVLACARVADNPPDRCYYCKQIIMSGILRAAAADGYPVLLDGTNASDDPGDRPGVRALKELGVLSPLRLCGLSKAEIRRRSREAGLFTWDKPAYACLATRVKSGERITAETLRAVEEGESALFALGFTDFRVRTSGGSALVQLRREQLGEGRERWKEIEAALSPWFVSAALDEQGREARE